MKSAISTSKTSSHNGGSHCYGNEQSGKRIYMNGEKNLDVLLQRLRPKLNEGEYVFCHVNDKQPFDLKNVIGSFREEEGLTVIIPKQLADERQHEYSFVASWITIMVHSSLEAVGLTAAFSTALSDAGISCNVIAAFYHDHIFVDSKDANRAMEVLKQLSKSDD